MFTYNEQGEKMKELMINKEGHVWNIFDYILYLENKIESRDDLVTAIHSLIIPYDTPIKKQIMDLLIK
jgi:hypothetical protein